MEGCNVVIRNEHATTHNEDHSPNFTLETFLDN